MGSILNALLDWAVTCRQTAHMCACGLDRYFTQEAEDFAVVVLAIRVPADKCSDSVHGHREVQTWRDWGSVFTSRFQVFHVHDAFTFEERDKNDQDALVTAELGTLGGQVILKSFLGAVVFSCLRHRVPPPRGSGHQCR